MDNTSACQTNYNWGVTTPKHKINLANQLANQLIADGNYIDENDFIDIPQLSYRFKVFKHILYTVGIGPRPLGYETFLNYLSTQPQYEKFLTYRPKRLLRSMQRKEIKSLSAVTKSIN